MAAAAAAAAARPAKNGSAAPQQALPMAAPAPQKTTTPPPAAANDAQQAARILQLDTVYASMPSSAAPAVPAVKPVVATVAVPAPAAPPAPATELLSRTEPTPQLLTAALPTAAVASGQLLAAGDDWQVHKLFKATSSADDASAQAPQQGMHNSNHFMILVRLPNGAISSSVDVKCGQRAIVVTYKKVGPSARHIPA